ncbi:MAG: hypothetical protein Tsb0018_12000 [Opitutales bacterium]
MLLALMGCSGSSLSDAVPETDERHYQRGQRLLREGREQEALSAFLKVIEKRRDAPESQLEAGRLYLRIMGDPIAATYHFRKYLEYKPQTEQSPMVRQLIETAQKEFARSLPGQPFADDVDRLDLLELLQQQREENLTLKRELALAKKQLKAFQSSDASSTHEVASMDYVATSSKPGSVQSSKVRSPDKSKQATLSTYKVQAGDTLTRVSTHVYGTSARWTDIFQANRDQLDSPHDLQPGQILDIP